MALPASPFESTRQVHVADAFERLFRAEYSTVVAIATRVLADSHEAEDVAQEAMLRAYRFFSGFRGGDARAWLLRIVRNTCYAWLEKNRPGESMTEFDEQLHGSGGRTPEALVISSEDQARVAQALETLTPRHREVIVLRELEGCSYKEIAMITGIPMGTVMSAISRARRQLQLALAKPQRQEAAREL